MKAHLSVFYLMARGTLHKVLLLLTLMAAAEGAAFSLLADGALGLEANIARCRPDLFFGAAFVLMTVLLWRNGCERGGRLAYTLYRLRVSRRAVFFWQAGYNAFCLLLLWAAQVLTVLGLCRLYPARAGAELISGQTVFLAFYRQPFLHSLLPLEELRRWLRNGFMILAYGLSAAAFPAALRRGKKFSLTAMATAAALLPGFTAKLGSVAGDRGWMLACAVLSAAAMATAWGEAEEDET